MGEHEKRGTPIKCFDQKENTVGFSHSPIFTHSPTHPMRDECLIAGLNKRSIQKGPVRNEHLSRVHNIEWIEGLFDSPHGVKAAAANLQFDEW